MPTLRILPAVIAAFLSLLATASSAWAQSITNGTFETPTVSTYQSNPAGSGWTWSGTGLAGISSGTWGGSGFGVTGTRTGQFAYLQWNAGVGGSVSQSVTFPTPGRYRLEESIGGRDLASGGHGNAAYAITVSGGIFSGGGNTFTGMPFQNYLDEIIVTTAGTYTLTYSNVTGSGDDTFFVDNVSITYLGPLILVPTVAQNTAGLGNNATTLIINGTNFSTTAGNNTVAFNNGAAGTVTAATATQLSVTFTTKPTSTGSLTAVVTSNGQSSGAAVQVATVVPSNPAGTNKSISIAAGGTHTFASSDWGFTDPNSSPADNFAAVTLTTLPSSGTLAVDSSPVTTAPRSVSMLPGPAGATWTARENNRYWFSITSSADGSKLAAVVSYGQIHTSTDGGVTWTARESNRLWNSITSSADGSRLAAVEQGGQIYTSTDGGVSWTARESNRDWLSITSSADGSKLAAIESGSNGGRIHTSTDGGVNWTARESNRYWSSITSSADGSKLAAVVYNGQIHTSTDGGVSWTAREINRPWSRITSSADGSKLAAVVNGGQIHTSTDGGMNWTARESSRSWNAIASSADGSKIAAAEFGGRIYTSTDGGANWMAGGSDRVWRSITSSADGSRLAAVADNSPIYTSVPSAPVISYSAPATAGSTSFTFQVQDDAASNNLDLSPNTITFNIVPTVTQSTANLGRSPSTLVITGRGFSTTPGNNTVSFSNGAGTVTAATATQLTVTFTTRPTSYGSLTAVVTSNGQSSGTAVQVATIIPSPPAGTDKTLTLAAGSTHTFAASDWGFTDPGSSPADNFSAVTLTTLPSTGTLAVDSSPVTTTPRSVSLVAAGPAGATWTARGSTRNWQSITSSADGSKLAAVVWGGQIHTSTDGGVSWTARESDRNWRSITSSADGSKLAAVADYGQIYTSMDAGVSWTARQSNRQWASITSSADGSKIAAAEFGGRIYTSTDGGANWMARESFRSWHGITSSADGSKLAAVVANAQIYTSTDWGSSWTARESNRSWRSITSSADGSKLAAVVWGGQIYTSTDGGVSWTARESNRDWFSIASSADGSKLAAVAPNGGQIYTSMDGGANWTARESSRPWQGITSSADGSKLAAVGYGGKVYTSEGSAPVISYSAPATAGSTSFTFQVQDDAASNNLDPSPNTITFNIVPTVVTSTAGLAPDATTLTITGTGFSTTPGNNTVVFSPAGSGTVTAATPTSLTVSSLSGLSPGTLSAVVTTNGQSSGAAVQVATVLTALQSWRQTHFGTTANTGTAADTHDADNDGLANLIEYAFALDSMAGGGAAQLPQAVHDAGANTFTVQFTEPAGVTGVTYGAQSSPSLEAGSWQPVPDTGTGGNHIFRVVLSGETRLFIRLEVTAAP